MIPDAPYFVCFTASFVELLLSSEAEAEEESGACYLEFVLDFLALIIGAQRNLVGLLIAHFAATGARLKAQ